MLVEQSTAAMYASLLGTTDRWQKGADLAMSDLPTGAREGSQPLGGGVGIVTGR